MNTKSTFAQDILLTLISVYVKMSLVNGLSGIRTRTLQNNKDSLGLRVFQFRHQANEVDSSDKGSPALLILVPKPSKGRKNFKAHELVMLAFVGPTPKGKVIVHKNGNTFDDRLENLEFDVHPTILAMQELWKELSSGVLTQRARRRRE